MPRQQQWPCGCCKKSCKTDAVFCGKCQRWFHTLCEVLTKEQYIEMDEMEQDFMCKGCSSHNGRFDFSSCLQRLNMYSVEDDAQSLMSAAHMEEILLRHYQIDTPPECVTCPRSDLSIDEDAYRKFKFYNGKDNGRKAIQVSGDGSCLFNAVAVALYGDESRALELRARTTIELILHGGVYECTYPTFKDVCSITDSISDGGKGGYSSAFTMAALSTVVQHPIASVYPPMNGIADCVFRLLTTTVHPIRSTILERNDAETVFIMWTKAGLVTSNSFWFPNHFVPLLVDTTSVEAEVNLLDASLLDPDVHIWQPPCSNSTFIESNKVLDADFNVTFSPPRSSTVVTITHEEDVDNLLTHFMDTKEAYAILKSSKPAQRDIPLGKKENRFFIVDNLANKEKRSKGHHSNFSDDCGVWDSSKGSTKKIEFVVDSKGNPRLTEKHQGSYFYNRKNPSTILDPQPELHEIYVIKRYYATLKRDVNYKKRITWIESAPPMLKDKENRAIVEYIGRFPESISGHGNAKTVSGEYIRTDGKTVDKIKAAAAASQPRVAYTNMVLESSVDCPRDLKQVQNFKQAVKQPSGDQKQHRQNSADHIQAVLSHFQENPFVQHVTIQKGKPPGFILYVPDQLKDIMRYCSLDASEPSVMGVDRTFNLGECFVTCVVYKNNRLLRKISQEPPIMLGPVYLHWDGSYDSYHAFFSHLQCQLDNTNLAGMECGISEMVVGSDEEKAILKAMKQCFPNSHQLLCSRHLQENARRRLQEKVGTKKTTQNDIMNCLFGPDGVSCADTSFDFDERSNTILSKVEEEVPLFAPYLCQKLLPAIRQHIFEPRQNICSIPLNWTNNCCEAMNHIFKLELNWTPHKLPDLIDKIKRIVDLQFADVRRALHGQGNFQLAPTAQQFQIAHGIWATKTQSEKDKLYEHFMTSRKRKRKDLISSTDGKLIVPCPPRLAKKPCQRARQKAAKTTTIPKSKRKEEN